MSNPSSDNLAHFPSVLGVLGYLAVAGPEGMIVGDIARLFDTRVSPARNHHEVNITLVRHERLGNVRRSRRMEPTTRYHKVPCWRWWITDQGLRYLKSGGYEGVRSSLREARGQRPSAQEKREARRAARLAALPLVNALPERDLAARNALIWDLRAQGVLTLEDIGVVTGLTRERVRQVLAGIRC